MVCPSLGTLFKSLLDVVSTAGPSQIHEVDMGSAAPPEPIIPEAEVSTGSECSLSLGGLELAYPSSRSASAGHATSQPLGLGKLQLDHGSHC